MTSEYYTISRTHKEYIIGAYIEVDYQKHVDGGMTQKEIVDACVSYLCDPPKKSKVGRKPKPKYGNLKLIRSSFCADCITVLLTTSDKKNSNFWGKGFPPKYVELKNRK